MSVKERTRQNLDPVGTYGNGLTTVVFSVGAFVVAVVMTINGFDRTPNPPLQALALLILGASSVLVVLAANPYRAPFTRRVHNLVVAGGLLAVGVDSISDWMSETASRNEWGSISLGLLFLAMGPYRPAKELVANGSLAAVFLGFLTVITVSPSSGLPTVALVAATIMPVLALTFASAAYSHGIIERLENWRRRMSRPGKVISEETEHGIARSVQQDRVTILNREVLPFFLELIDKPMISDGDRERARDIASSVRSVMVAEVDRSWLEHVLDELTRGRCPTEAPPVLRDDDHLANLMTYDQRTALRAFIVALRDLPEAPGPLKIDIFPDRDMCSCVIVATFDMADFALRSRFAAYFAVLRVMFSELRIEYLHGALTLSFCYEQR